MIKGNRTITPKRKSASKPIHGRRQRGYKYPVPYKTVKGQKQYKYKGFLIYQTLKGDYGIYRNVYARYPIARAPTVNAAKRRIDNMTI